MTTFKSSPRPVQTSSRCLYWIRLEDVFTPMWTIKPVTTVTSSGLPSSRLQDRCRRLQYVFIEDFLKTSSHPWEQLKPLTRGTSSWLPSSRLPDRCRRLQGVFIKDFLEDVFTPLRTIKTVIWGGGGRLQDYLQFVSQTGPDVFIEVFFTTSSQRLQCVCTHMPCARNFLCSTCILWLRLFISIQPRLNEHLLCQ